jgi:UrcA family protein
MIRTVILAAYIAAIPASALAERQVALSNEGDMLLRIVSYQDLDIRTPQGAKAMYSRLRYASWIACKDPLVTDKTPAARRDERACSATLLHSALDALQEPRLDQLHTGRTPARD